MSELIAKELKALKKAENKEEDMDQEHRSQVMSILRESQLSSNGNAAIASVFLGLSSSMSTLNVILKTIKNQS